MSFGIGAARRGLLKRLGRKQSATRHEPTLSQLPALTGDLELRLDTEGRVLGCSDNLSQRLGDHRSLVGLPLTLFIKQSFDWLELPPSDWPTTVPWLTLQVDGSTPIHCAVFLYPEEVFPEEKSYRMALAEISDLVVDLNQRDAKAMLLRKAERFALQIRMRAEGWQSVVEDWLEDMALRLGLRWVALVVEEGIEWRTVGLFQRSGSMVDVPSISGVRLGGDCSYSPIRGNSDDGQALLLVPYHEQGQAQAWLYCGHSEIADPLSLHDEEWSALLAIMAGPVLQRARQQTRKQVLARQSTMDELLCGGWWEFYREGSILRLSPSLMKHLQVPEECYDGLAMEQWLALVEPGDQHALQALLEDCTERLLHTLCFRVNGEARWYRLEGEVVHSADGVCIRGFALDVHDVRTTEKEAESAKARLTGLVDSVPGIIYLASYDAGALRPSFYSASVTTLLGWQVDHFSSRPYATFIHTDDREAYFSHQRALLQGGRSTCQYRLLCSDDSYRWVQDEARLLRDERGIPAEVVGLCLDITEVRSTREQLFQSAKLATLGEMATGLAHEISQPLSVMHVSVNNLLNRMGQGVLAQDYLAEKLERIASQVARTAGIVDHMRVFGRQADEEGIPFNPEDAVAIAVSLVDESMAKDGVELQLDIEPVPPVSGHPDRLSQVLINLLLNAKYAALEHCKKTNTTRPKVVLACTDAGNEVVINVKDNGAGIAPEVIERIFEPFFTTKPIGEGTGLGLSVSYSIIKQMSGELQAKSSADGAISTVRLPAIKLGT